MPVVRPKELVDQGAGASTSVESSGHSQRKSSEVFLSESEYDWDGATNASGYANVSDIQSTDSGKVSSRPEREKPYDIFSSDPRDAPAPYDKFGDRRLAADPTIIPEPTYGDPGGPGLTTGTGRAAEDVYDVVASLPSGASQSSPSAIVPEPTYGDAQFSCPREPRQSIYGLKGDEGIYDVAELADGRVQVSLKRISDGGGDALHGFYGLGIFDGTYNTAEIDDGASAAKNGADGIYGLGQVDLPSVERAGSSATHATMPPSADADPATEPDYELSSASLPIATAPQLVTRQAKCEKIVAGGLEQMPSSEYAPLLDLSKVRPTLQLGLSISRLPLRKHDLTTDVATYATEYLLTNTTDKPLDTAIKFEGDNFRVVPRGPVGGVLVTAEQTIEGARAIARAVARCILPPGAHGPFCLVEPASGHGTPGTHQISLEVTEIPPPTTTVEDIKGVRLTRRTQQSGDVLTVAFECENTATFPVVVKLIIAGDFEPGGFIPRLEIASKCTSGLGRVKTRGNAEISWTWKRVEVPPPVVDAGPPVRIELRGVTLIRETHPSAVADGLPVFSFSVDSTRDIPARVSVEATDKNGLHEIKATVPPGCVSYPIGAAAVTGSVQIKWLWTKCKPGDKITPPVRQEAVMGSLPFSDDQAAHGGAGSTGTMLTGPAQTGSGTAPQAAHPSLCRPPPASAQTIEKDYVNPEPFSEGYEDAN